MRACMLWLVGLSCLLGCPTRNGSANTDSSSTGDTDDATTSATDDESTDTGDVGYCDHQCTVDADCLIDGDYHDFVCIDGDCKLGCTSDEECVAKVSLWTRETPCTPGGSECDVTELNNHCLDVLGQGRCVPGVTDTVGCRDQMRVEIETIDIDGNPVVVCGFDNAICVNGACEAPCPSDEYCFHDTPICNVDTGVCMCGSDADCQLDGKSSAATCMPGGFCGCTDDQQCIDDDLGDVCTAEGRCGCTSVAGCDETPHPGYDGGVISCL